MSKDQRTSDVAVRSRSAARGSGEPLTAPVRTPDAKPRGPELPRAVSPAPVPEGADLGHPSLYFNRELSWLDFNWRVLHQAMDDRSPLLERVKFLAICASNLDEFFGKRVGGLKRQERAGVTQLSPDGRTPRQQLRLIREAVSVMRARMGGLWEGELRPALRHELGVVIRDYDTLNARDRMEIEALFQSNIYPVLTPLAVDQGHPFPHISNLSISLAVQIEHPARGTSHFARVKIPANRGRWIPLGRPNHFVPVEQVVKEHVAELFRGMRVKGAHLFRLTRNADTRRDEEEAEDLLRMISDELRERRFAPVVRLEMAPGMPPQVLTLLSEELDLEEDDIYAGGGLLGLSDLMELVSLDLPAGRYPGWEPVTPPPLVPRNASDGAPSIFKIIRGGDVMVHHPFESFTTSVQRFVEEAADDPRVLAIKQTLYRTSEDSPVVRALIRAAEAGKEVAVLVELTARFDELNNIEWAQMLGDHGVHVTYGMVGLKTHCKTALVVREEEDGIRAYCHIGTGNYHSGTARLYSDLGILTCRPEVGADLINLFHYLTGYAPEQRYTSVIVAPRDLRRRFAELIEREIVHQEEHGDGRIIAKMNAIDDQGMIQLLYRAGRAGVRIELIIRGHTRLRPGLPGYSENIRIISIVGRFLEHDRIFYFHNHTSPEFYVGSADLRRRNLEDRVEAVMKVEDPVLKGRLFQMLGYALVDNRLAWDLDSRGAYRLRHPAPGEPERNYHEVLMKSVLMRRDEMTTPWDVEPEKAAAGRFATGD